MSSVFGSIDFRQYLIDYEFFTEYFKYKTKKQFKNALMELYGKKKDRGHIKEKYEIAKNKALKEKAEILNMFAIRFPILPEMMRWL